MKTIERFYDEDPEDLNLFFNGKYDFWHEMPVMNRENKKKVNILCIEFKSEEEILEFYKLIDFKGKWGGEKDIIPKNSKGFRVRFPNNLMNRYRNSNYRFVHKDTALANPDLYEIIPLEVLHYEAEGQY